MEANVSICALTAIIQGERSSRGPTPTLNTTPLKVVWVLVWRQQVATFTTLNLLLKPTITADLVTSKTLVSPINFRSTCIRSASNPHPTRSFCLFFKENVRLWSARTLVAETSESDDDPLLRHESTSQTIAELWGGRQHDVVEDQTFFAATFQAYVGWMFDRKESGVGAVSL